LPARLESRVLLQRPDVLYAEHTLKAANADIGAARAAFFPTISLTASTGRGSDALSNLFDGGNRTWSFVPSISVPIFQAGALKAELDVAKIQKEVTVAEYEQAIQSAFAEVADALAERAQLDERLDAQRALVDATRRSYTLADARYRNGVDSYLDALDAQRTLYTAQQTLISLRLTEAGNRVTLYKVLGGGADAQAGATPVAAVSDR
ncbi:efflux transporter outer membrane subunit, partial [Xanthomonas sp. Kuri4-1]